MHTCDSRRNTPLRSDLCSAEVGHVTGTHHRSSHRRGFSLVELLVCIAIIVAISAVVLARYKTFNSTILLRALAYEIALSVRESQVRGISVQGSGGVFGDAYGMHFTAGTSYMLFADIDDNNRYDTGEEIFAYTISQNNRVADMCANEICGLTSLDILFRRPEPDALFSVDPNVSSISSVRVVIGAPDGSTRTVRVWPTGQIEIY